MTSMDCIFMYQKLILEGFFRRLKMLVLHLFIRKKAEKNYSSQSYSDSVHWTLNIVKNSPTFFKLYFKVKYHWNIYCLHSKPSEKAPWPSVQAENYFAASSSEESDCQSNCQKNQSITFTQLCKDKLNGSIA